jgi:hypothetical protein
MKSVLIRGVDFGGSGLIREGLLCKQTTIKINLQDFIIGRGLWCLTPLSTIFQLCRGGGNRITQKNNLPAANL